MTLLGFEELRCWQHARELNHQLYSITRKPDFSKDYALKDQLIRASVSIVLNISEGFDSGTPKSFLLFLNYSFRSTSEVKAILFLALDEKYITKEEFTSLESKLVTLRKMLSGLKNHLKRKIKK